MIELLISQLLNCEGAWAQAGAEQVHEGGAGSGPGQENGDNDDDDNDDNNDNIDNDDKKHAGYTQRYKQLCFSSLFLGSISPENFSWNCCNSGKIKKQKDWF